MRLVIGESHEGEGIKAAVGKVLKANWQRCRVHFIRNALAYAPSAAFHHRNFTARRRRSLSASISSVRESIVSMQAQTVRDRSNSKFQCRVNRFGMRLEFNTLMPAQYHSLPVGRRLWIGLWRAALLALLQGILAMPALSASPVANGNLTLFEVDLKLRWDRGGSASGTVLEASGPGGRVLGIGFPEIFNTSRHYRDRHLSVFVRDGDDSVELINLGRPPHWMTSVFHRDGARGERLSLLNMPLSWVRSIPTGSPPQWMPVDREVFTYNAMRGYGHDPRSLSQDCGFITIGRIDHGLFGNCLMTTNGIFYFNRIASRFNLPTSHRLRPSWFDNHVLVLQHIDDRSAQLGFVACTMRTMIEAEDCSYTRFENPGEFLYGHGRRDGGVIVTSNFGNVWQIGLVNAAVNRLRVSDGTSLQLYASVRYGSELWWGEYPTGSVLTFDIEGRLQRIPAQLPIDNYRHSAGAELQTFALYKGDLFAGVWPFGQVYRHSREAGEWVLVDRFFSAPLIERGAKEPFLDEVGSNEAGQRINDMISHGDSLYVATSSKSGVAAALPASLRERRIEQEYGNVYRLRMSGALSVGLPAQHEMIVRVHVTSEVIEITLDGILLGSTRIAAQNLGCISRIALSESTFGNLIGPVAEAVVRVNRLTCRE